MISRLRLGKIGVDILSRSRSQPSENWQLKLALIVFFYVLESFHYHFGSTHAALIVVFPLPAGPDGISPKRGFPFDIMPDFAILFKIFLIMLP